MRADPSVKPSDRKEYPQAGLLIARIHQKGGRIFNRILKKADMDRFNSAQGRILFVLWQGDAIPIQTLAERTGLGKSTLTSMLDRLEADSLVRRDPSPGDRRSFTIALTGEGRALRSAYEAVSEEMNRLFFEGFTDGEIDGFEAMLLRIDRNLNVDGE